MKYCVAVFLFAGALLFGADRADLDRVLDFSVTMESLDGILNGEIPFDESKFVALEGTIESVTILDKTPESFLAIAGLVRGTWDGLEKIRIFRCMLRFSGPDFSGTVSNRPSDDPAMISLNGRILAIGRLGTVEMEDGSITPLLDVVLVRRL